MAQQRLVLTIEADNRASSQALAQTNQQIGGLEQIALRVARSISTQFNNTFTQMAQQARQLVDQFGRPISAATSGLKDAAGAANQFGNSLSGSMFKAMALFETLKQGAVVVKDLVVGSTLYAARVEQLGFSLAAVAKGSNISQQTVATMESRIRALGITTEDARMGISRFIASGLDFKRIGEAAQAAQNLGRVGGIPTAEAFERLTQAVVTGQPEMLRTLGIAVNFDSAYRRVAATLGTTADHLTETEKLQARFNVAMEAAQSYSGAYAASLESVGGRLLSLQRHLKDAKVAIGQQFLPELGVAAGTAEAVSKAAYKGVKVGNTTLIEGQTISRMLSDIIRQGTVAAGVITLAFSTGPIGIFIGSLAILVGTLSVVVRSFKDLKDEVTTLKDLFSDDDHWTRDVNDLLGNLNSTRLRETTSPSADNLKTYYTLLNRKRLLAGQYTNMTPAEMADAAMQIQVNRLNVQDDAAQKAAKKRLEESKQANEEARRKLAELQREEYDGVARLMTERDQELARLKAKGVEQKLINQLGEQYNKNIAEGVQALNLELDKLSRDKMGKYLENLGKSYHLWLDQWQIIQKANQETSQMVGGVNSWISSAYTDVAEMKKWRDLRPIETEEASGNVTLSRQLELNQQRLEIEKTYQQEMLQIELKAFQERQELRAKEIALDVAGLNVDKAEKDHILAQRLELLRIAGNLEKESIGTKSFMAERNAEKSEQISRYRLIYESNKRLFDQLKQSSEAIFDTMLQKSQSVWQAMAGALKNAFLTVFREIVSSQVARSLTSLLTGRPVALSAGDTAMTGTAGRVRNLVGGLMGLGGPMFGVAGVAAASSAPASQAAASSSQASAAVQQAAASSPGAVTKQVTDAITKGGSSGSGIAAGLKSLFGFGQDSWVNLGGGRKATGDFILQYGSSLDKLKAIGKSNAALMAGIGLAMDGWNRGGKFGMLETTAGGAAIGFKYGGGIGAAIGAVAGAIAGGIRMMIGTPEQEMQKRINALTGLNVTEKSILRQAVEMAKQQAGGNYDLWIRSKNGQDFLELYAANTGKKFRSAFTVSQFSMVQTGGGLYEMPSFLNGSALNPISNLPGMGFSAALDQVQGGGMATGPVQVVLQIDGPATQSLMRGEAVSVMASPAGQRASLSATKASTGRSQMAAALTSPFTVTR